MKTGAMLVIRKSMLEWSQVATRQRLHDAKGTISPPEGSQGEDELGMASNPMFLADDESVATAATDVNDAEKLVEDEDEDLID